MMGIQKISKHGAEEIKLIAEAAKNYPKIEAIYLFGSCARHEDTENSDVDTLIIWNGFNESDDLINEESELASDFVDKVFDKKLFNWDRLFLDSIKELEDKDGEVYTHIKSLNNIIYKRK